VSRLDLYHARVHASPFVSTLLGSLLLLGCGAPPTDAAPRERTDASEPAPASVPTEPERGEACSAATLEPAIAAYCDFEAQVPGALLAGVAWTGPAFHLLDQRLLVIDEQARVRVVGEAGEHALADWLALPGVLADTRPLVLAVAATLPRSRVAELFAALHAASRQEVAVLVRSDAAGQTLPSPPSPSLLASIGEQLSSDLGQRAAQLATQMREHTQTCPALATAFASLAAFSPADRCTGMASLVAAALVECDCRDADAIMTLLYAISVGTEIPRGRVSAVTLTLDPAASEPASGERWSEVVDATLRDASPTTLWLASAPPSPGR
jgi:hypothetical protein